MFLCFFLLLAASFHKGFNIELKNLLPSMFSLMSGSDALVQYYKANAFKTDLNTFETDLNVIHEIIKVIRCLLLKQTVFLWTSNNADK